MYKRHVLEINAQKFLVIRLLAYATRFVHIVFVPLYLTSRPDSFSPRKSAVSRTITTLPRREDREIIAGEEIRIFVSHTDGGRVRVPFQMLIGVNRRHSLRGRGGAAGCRSSVKRIEASVAVASRRRRGTRSGEGEGKRSGGGRQAEWWGKRAARQSGARKRSL